MGFALSCTRAVFFSVVLTFCLAGACNRAARAQGVAPQTQGAASVEAPAPAMPVGGPGGPGDGTAQPSASVSGSMPVRAWVLDPERFHSLFFSTWTHDLLDEARRGLKSRAPTASELAAGVEGLEEDKKDPGIRELSLGGIVYADADDWTVWLNGQRVRQDAIPPEVLDLRVFETYIDLKWFDAYTNQVFPIRLRPHQRFNLDSRIFLPG